MAHALTVNGRDLEVEVPPFYPLAVVLRDELGLIGTKAGCFEGRCGACAVIVDGRTVASCIYPVGLAEGASIRTVESLAGVDGQLSDLQEALLEEGGVQCGVCTPGVLMTLTSLLERKPTAGEREIREELSGNLCRCTGYQGIVNAALSVTGGTS